MAEAAHARLKVEGLGVVVTNHDAPATPLLSAVSFSLDAGEITAVVGPSGSGKTSLLRALARLSPSAGGTVVVDGKRAETIDVPTYRRQVHYVFQRPRLGTKSVRDALLTPFRFASARGDEVPEEKLLIAKLVAVGLSAAIFDKDTGELSEGERQRVAFVRSLLLRPKVLLLDEPTSALDKDSRAQVEAEVQRFADEGGAVLLITHDEDQMQRLASAILDVTRFRSDAPATEENRTP